MAAERAELRLGPMLRRVDGDRAGVWVETDRPAVVCVVAGAARGEARTFAAFGHHYAYVLVEGLPPDADTPYQVELDGRRVWPPADDRFPPCRIRTGAGDRPVRIVFGSCREVSPLADSTRRPDSVDAYASRLTGDPDARPDLVMLLGDQVYADEISPTTRRFLRRHRDRRDAPDLDEPADQASDYEEYSRLYDESWTDPEVRWLLSTVPSAMIFDDHEIVDDWNTSATWRRQITALPWWRRRITGGLASYWVYQHLGNLPLAELGTDPLAARARRGEDLTEALVTMARQVDGAADRDQRDGDEAGDATGPHWCQRRDLGPGGRTRLLVIDNRCGRVLAPGGRSMLSPADWRWLEESVTGEYDHLVLCASLPWLLPPAVHHLEAASEALAGSPRRPVAALAEKLRQGADLEHWAAFHDSFERLGRLLGDLGAGRYGPPPASISVLSGDVHHSYLARAELPAAVRTPVWQLTCSPTHNVAPAALKLGFRAGWTRLAARIGAGIARLSGVPAPGLRWRRTAGPFFHNALGTLEVSGRTARVALEGTERRPEGTARLISLASQPLTGEDHG